MDLGATRETYRVLILVIRGFSSASLTEIGLGTRLIEIKRKA